MPSTHIQAGVVGLIADAGPVAKLVLFVLLAASVFCWAIILMKWRSLKRAIQQNTEFLNVFWHGKNIDEIIEKVGKYGSSPIAAVFQSGVKELKKLSATDAANASERVENIYRALVRTSNAEIAAYEHHVGWLATTASAAPFVGLFGTVWGIMNSFQSIGVTGAANLAVVAPGISEALITTATGIAAAVPAVIAYNHFVGQIKRLSVEMECFTHDFLNIIQRNVLAGRKGH
ncbi:MAG TPA: protein TolQ [Bdellovibrionota bacterium]|nr:protein TolQ [Bdellovibrionota bacterium]